MRKITDDEIEYFDEHGFVICRNVLHADELDHLRAGTTRLIDEILQGGPAAAQCRKGPEGIPFYLNYLHANPNDFSLRLLAHPFIGDLLARMVGPDFIPCFESLVFKLPDKGSSVPWHRDGDLPRDDERVFNIDIYPDRSTIENGCVWAIPGSHKWSPARAAQAIQEGKKNFNLPGAVPAQVEPGDVLLHHTKVLHGSARNESKALRRVIYFDNRAVRWNEKYRWWTPGTLAKRCQLFQCALHERQTHPYPSDDEQFAYTPPAGMPSWKPGDTIDLKSPREPRKA